MKKKQNIANIETDKKKQLTEEQLDHVNGGFSLNGDKLTLDNGETRTVGPHDSVHLSRVSFGNTSTTAPATPNLDTPGGANGGIPKIPKISK